MIVSEAIKKIKEGNVLYSYINKKKHLFRMKNNMVMVLNINSSFYLSFEDFTTLYHNETFEIIEDDNEEIDSKKDEEYYSLGGLKH